MNTNYAVSLLGFILLLFACDEKPTSSEGDVMKETTISADDFEGTFYEITAEEDLCDLVNIAVLTKHFPGAENYHTKGVGLSQYGMNNGGCAISWSPKEDIGRQQADNYYHISPRASVEIKYNVNPDTSRIDKFAHQALDRKMNPEYKKGPDSLELDSKYYKVDNVGSFAIWNDGSSSLEFAVGEDMLFTVVIKYPKPSEERKAIAKDIAQSVIENMLSQ